MACTCAAVIKNRGVKAMGSSASAEKQRGQQSEQEATCRSSDVTAVITSCGRHDLLVRTLDSFLRFNTYPLHSILVIEDGPAIPKVVRQRYQIQVIWKSTGQRQGQIAAVDEAYREVRTPYIFHLEDDWEFYRPSFIEQSKAIMESNRDCLQVYLRAHNDVNGHPIQPEKYYTDSIPWRKMSPMYNYDGVMWHGFSFNPGLRRLSDYQQLGHYQRHAEYSFDIPWKAEWQLSSVYYSLGFYAAILADHEGSGYVRHLGRGRRVPPPTADQNNDEER